jgi:hypothetical protein
VSRVDNLFEHASVATLALHAHSRAGRRELAARPFPGQDAKAGPRQALRGGFKLYVGETAGPALLLSAALAGQSISLTWCVWLAIRGSAAECEGDGGYAATAESIAADLESEPSRIAAILAAFEDPVIGWVRAGVVLRWRELYAIDDDSPAPQQTALCGRPPRFVHRARGPP